MAPEERDQTAIEELRTLIRAQARRIEDLESPCVRVASLGMPLTARLNPASCTGQRGEVFTFNGIPGGIGVATRDGEGDLADMPLHLVVSG